MVLRRPDRGVKTSGKGRALALSIAEMVHSWMVFFGSSSLSFCDENAVMTRLGLPVGACADSTVLMIKLVLSESLAGK